MNPATRFAKTEKGREEIRDRKYALQPRLRTLLVMIDGSKTADELVQAAKRLGGGQEVLQELLKEGFIDEAGGDGAAAPAAAAAPTEADREKLYAAKAAMRRYIKMASVETRSLNEMVDQVRTPDQLPSAMRKIGRVFEASGFGEAFANLSREISAG